MGESLKFLHQKNIFKDLQNKLGPRRGWDYHSIGILSKKQLERVLKETRPDVIYAHNIFSAKMVSEFEIPFVYDDHEFCPDFQCC